MRPLFPWYTIVLPLIQGILYSIANLFCTVFSVAPQCGPSVCPHLFCIPFDGPICVPVTPIIAIAVSLLPPQFHPTIVIVFVFVVVIVFVIVVLLYRVFLNVCFAYTSRHEMAASVRTMAEGTVEGAILPRSGSCDFGCGSCDRSCGSCDLFC